MKIGQYLAIVLDDYSSDILLRPLPKLFDWLRLWLVK